MLDWRQTVTYLRALTGENVIEEGPIQPTVPAAPPSPTEGPDWEEARTEGCESPQELRLLKAIRADGTMPEPTKQHQVMDNGRVLTRADFAYLDCQPQLLIYVDGLEWHSEPRQRSPRQPHLQPFAGPRLPRPTVPWNGDAQHARGVRGPVLRSTTAIRERDEWLLVSISAGHGRLNCIYPA